MTARIGSCLSCVSCESCGNPAYCLDDTAAHPCPHDRALCSDCNIEDCRDCRLEAEADMYHSGQYDPRADPFYRPEKEADTAAYAARLPREKPDSPGTFIYPEDDAS